MRAHPWPSADPPRGRLDGPAVRGRGGRASSPLDLGRRGVVVGEPYLGATLPAARGMRALAASVPPGRARRALARRSRSLPALGLAVLRDRAHDLLDRRRSALGDVSIRARRWRPSSSRVALVSTGSGAVDDEPSRRSRRGPSSLALARPRGDRRVRASRRRWDIAYPFQARGTDWGHYLLYADEVAAQGHLLIDDPFAGEDDRIFADPPAVGAIYGSFLLLDGDLVVVADDRLRRHLGADGAERVRGGGGAVGHRRGPGRRRRVRGRADPARSGVLARSRDDARDGLRAARGPVARRCCSAATRLAAQRSSSAVGARRRRGRPLDERDRRRGARRSSRRSWTSIARLVAGRRDPRAALRGLVERRDRAAARCTRSGSRACSGPGSSGTSGSRAVRWEGR